MKFVVIIDNGKSQVVKGKDIEEAIHVAFKNRIFYEHIVCIAKAPEEDKEG